MWPMLTFDVDVRVGPLVTVCDVPLTWASPSYSMALASMITVTFVVTRVPGAMLTGFSETLGRLPKEVHRWASLLKTNRHMQ